MALHTPVPSETEPTSLIDLANDCREVASVLGASVIDLTRAVVRVPLQSLPIERLPFSFGAMPAEITEDLMADLMVTVDGLDDY